MDVVSTTSLRGAARAWPSLTGGFRLTVVYKATCLLTSGVARLAAPNQPELCCR